MSGVAPRQGASPPLAFGGPCHDQAHAPLDPIMPHGMGPACLRYVLISLRLHCFNLSTSRVQNYSASRVHDGDGVMVHDEVLKIQIAAWPGPQGPQALNVGSMEPGWMGSTHSEGRLHGKKRLGPQMQRNPFHSNSAQTSSK